MSLKRKLHQAYDTVHAPEETVARRKQALYQREQNGDAEIEFYDVEEAPRRPAFLKYVVYVAAVAALFACGAGFWKSAQEQRIELHPASQVLTETMAGQESVMPDLVGMPAKQAQELLRQYGCEVSYVYQKSDAPGGTVIAQNIAAGAPIPDAAAVILTVSE